MSMNIPSAGTGAFGLCCGQDNPSASGRPTMFSGQNVLDVDNYTSQNDEKSKKSEKSEKKESFASSMTRGALQLIGGIAVAFRLSEKGLATQLLGGLAVGGLIGAIYSIVHQKMTTGHVDGKQLAKDTALGLIGI